MKLSIKFASLLILSFLFSDLASARCQGWHFCHGWFRDGSGLCGKYTVTNGLQGDFRHRIDSRMCAFDKCEQCQPESASNPAPVKNTLTPTGKANQFRCSPANLTYEFYDELNDSQWAFNIFAGGRWLFTSGLYSSMNKVWAAGQADCESR